MSEHVISQDIYKDIDPVLRGKLLWLIVLTKTESDVFPPEIILREVERYVANPRAYVFDDPLFLLPYMEQIFGGFPTEVSCN